MTQSYEWYHLGDLSYRKIKIYDMKWPNLSLNNVMIAAEKYGGHIAVANNLDENGAKKTQFTILFYTSTGQMLNKAQWKNGDLICMEWSPDSEELICVQNDGRVFVYSLFGIEKEDRRFSMGQEAQEMKLINCRLFDSYSGTGLCVLTKMNRFYIVNNVEDPKVWRTAEIHAKPNCPPSCWTVLSKDRVTKVIYTIGYEIFSAEQGKLSEPMVPAFSTPVKQYVAMALSPNKEKIALMTENNLLQIISADVQQTFCECVTSNHGIPKLFAWCGNEAVAVTKNVNYIDLIGLNGDVAPDSVYFDENVYALEEIDGIRLFDNSSQEFLEKVPNVCKQAFTFSSLAPSANLVEAYKAYAQKSYRTHELVRMVGDIQTAVRDCIEAALNEYKSEDQKFLLQAASLGRAFVHDADADTLAQAGRTLRVLNAVRDKLIGIPLTYAQFQHLTSSTLIDRLIYRSQWPLALACSKHLRFAADTGVNKVLAHWASKKISNKTQQDSQVAEQICRKFAEYPGVSFVDAAQKAAELGRKELATLLLENESNLERQVTMLMKLGRNEKALSRACESGDPDLISFVILHLRMSLEKKSDLDLILRNFPAAFSLYKIYCRDENPLHLKSLLKQTDDFYSQGLSLLKEASSLTMFDAREKIDSLKEAENCFRQFKDEYSAHQLNDESKLVKYQAEYEEKFGHSFLDLSLRETLIKLIELGEHNRTQLLKKEFQISDKQFWCWKIDALAKSSQWVELETFSKLKKSPVGYLPFIEVAMKFDQINEAKKYLTKVLPEEKIKALIKMKLLDEAVTLGHQQKDEHSLNRILAHCGPQNRNISERINQIKNELSISKQK